jgi:peptidoglycan/xylan/chitin deacetylase (PgdA/CDA1 family)
MRSEKARNSRILMHIASRIRYLATEILIATAVKQDDQRTGKSEANLLRRTETCRRPKGGELDALPASQTRIARVFFEMNGTITISIDFELRWGLHDQLRFDTERYRKNLEEVPRVIPDLLQALAQHGVRATWAMVGALACTDWTDYFRRAPAPPRYQDPHFTFDKRYAEIDPDGYLHFAPSLVDMIAKCPGQEIGTHTFSHLFLGEAGVSAADVEADLSAAIQIHEERVGSAPVSLVFPRNQCAFLDVSRAKGIRIWRGNERDWYFNRNDSRSRSTLVRGRHVLDAINPWTCRAAPLEGDMTRSSLFFRPSLPDYLWPLHVRKIENSVSVMKPGDVFHMWFHPHNFGIDRVKRLARLQQVLAVMAELAHRRKLEFRSMRELHS